jgi:hypothetical protein
MTSTAHKTVAELDLERPRECPNFGTRKACGGRAAVQGGCSVGPCKETKSVTARRASAQRRSQETLAQQLERLERDNAFRPKGTRSDTGRWVWHTKECCVRAWRPKGWDCLKMEEA